MQNSTNIVYRIRRILQTGEIIGIDKNKLLTMGDELVDPTIDIRGQLIPVWGKKQISNILIFSLIKVQQFKVCLMRIIQILYL